MAITLSEGASSSSGFDRGWTYDVFLSFRGEDTRRSFTGFLYHGLCQRGINVFIDDDKLRKGEDLSPTLLGAIQESRIAIIVFSQNYAFSTWCLDELAKIIDCYKTRGQLVWPVFFHVDPSVVRHQRGTFQTAMAQHEVRFKGNVEKLQKWKKALFEASNFSGWNLENGYEFQIIQDIVEEASRKLSHTILHIAEYPVGIEIRISEVMPLLQIEPGEDIRVIGIYGLGGIGKTTIARALYNMIADQFEATSFLSDIRESSNQRQGLVQLQESLLFDTVGDKNIKLGSIYKGIPIIKKRLCCKKVLLIIDDVDRLEQLQALAGGRDWFGFGSVIIITTRDKHLLSAHQVDKTYEVKKLNYGEAFELFTWSAFKRKAPDAGYLEVSNRVVLYAEGLPLALKIMGSNLFGKTVEEWKSALGKYEKIPNKEVQNVLRVTYDNLEENEKEIFLDVACFFKGETVEYVENTLQGCGFYPTIGISVLIDRSLVSIDEYNRLRMHDLIQDMGREIVREVSPLEPGKRSRLWYHEDVFEVLTENKGTYRIQGMMVDLPDDYMVHLKDDSFKKMKNLKILIVRNGNFFGSPQHLPNSLRLLDWMKYPSSLPSSFQPKKLVVLNLSGSRFTMQEPFKYLDSLTSMDLSSCELLTKLPEIAGVPNLTQLTLDYCTNLEEVHESVGFLEKLVEFRAYGCTKLKVFPNAIRLTSLRSLILNWCSSLQNFPAILGKMDNLISISIEGTGIKELPPSIGNLVSLQELSMTSCLNLKELPHNFDMLQSLTNLDMEGCPHLRNFLTKLANMGESTHTFGNILSLNVENCGLIDEDLPIIFNNFPNLASVVLSGNHFKALPSCIQQCPCLELLHLDNCKNIQEISAFPPNMQYINAQNCISLSEESSNLLFNKETFEGWELQAMVPGTMVPEWFDHITKGEYMTFWVRERFPAIIICFVLEVESEMKKIFNCEIRFYINGEEVYELQIPRGFSDMVTDHVWLYDLRTHSSINWRSLDLYLMDGWNQVEISCEKISGASNLTVSWCGVHVVKQEANMKDILLTDPDPDLDSVIASGSNTLVSDHPVKAQPQSQVTSFTLQTPQNNNSSTIVLPTTVQTSLTVNDADMEAFYAVLDDEISVVSLNNDSTMVSKLTNQRPSEETKKALKTLQAHVTKEFSALLGPNEYSTVNDTLEYLTNLPAEDEISVEIRSLIIQVSRQFTRWSRDYTSENKKIESTTAKLLKADELEKCLEANKTNFKQVMCMENELCNDLAHLEQRKRELEEQINAVKANISASEAAKNMASEIKRELFGKAKILKAERDELREQVPHLRDEQELAKKIQSNIRDEWSKLGEKFNYGLRHGKID
ncbi:TMV resistance protein N isoform X2 [Vigna radiata var. radiata]|uniref:TMV resistance protein N isoform X2 n=1 Tax=Vigna radiata var. radiata TaxID=3916 RepID=A0A1S3U1V3_VIGRR|nr:TMV resistance protein N isoform X2 [Vigna radiata var. radiata]